MMAHAREVTAAVLLIGDELLSGRTQDANLQAIARFLNPLGVNVVEARVVSDDQAAIVEALNALRARADYVFTTGGIGPTHDDITAEAVAAAFGVACHEHPDAVAALEAHYRDRPETLTPARRRMARAPVGAVLVDNPTSGAPGFQIDNVFILAGVPAIMRAMLAGVAQRLEGGAVTLSCTIQAAGLREGDVGDALSALQDAHPDVAVGSYPYYRATADFGVQLVARGRDAAALEAVAAALEALVRSCGIEPERVTESVS